MIHSGSTHDCGAWARRYGCSRTNRPIRHLVPMLGLIAMLVPVVTLEAAAIRPTGSFSLTTLPPNDDASTALVPIGFTVDFFGTTATQLYVNNNGNITFDTPLSSFTPFDLTSTNRQIIAPFFADVDTRNHGEPVTYGTGIINGRNAFVVNWIDVDYFASSTTHGSQLNSFQLVLIDRSDTGAGNFDIEFNYDKILWETGNASGGSGGLGGNSARVGFSNGTGNPGTFFELPGSAVNGAFLDSNLDTGLIHNRLNSSVDGRYVFQARSGDVSTEVIPEPASLTLLGMVALAGCVARGRRRR